MEYQGRRRFSTKIWHWGTKEGGARWIRYPSSSFCQRWYLRC